MPKPAPSPAHRRACRAAVVGAAALALAGLPLGSARAQWELGLAGGGSTYTGEFAPARWTDQWRTTGFSYGAYLRYEPLPWLGVRLAYTDLDLFGDDADRPSSRDRNLSFYTDLDEVALLAELYPFGQADRFTLYGLAGVAGYRFDPLTYDAQGEAVYLQPLGTEGQGLEGFPERYRLTQAAIPFGAGVRVLVGTQWTLRLEALSRLTFTDYLDDVSGVYVDEAVLSANGPRAVELAYRGDELPGAEPGTGSPTGSRRGNERSQDYYQTVLLTLGYRLGGGGAGGRRSPFRRNGGIPCPKL